LSLDESFHVGQVVKCRIKKIDVEKKRVSLSFNLTPKTKEDGGPKESRNKGENIQVGTVVSATVVSKSPEGIRVSIGPEKAIGFVLTTHLSDHPALCSQIYGMLAEGAILKGLLVLFRDLGGNLFLTNKPALVRAAKSGALPDSISKISVGKVYYGYIRNVTDYGCFIGFLGEMVGLATRKELSDHKIVRTLAESFPLGSTVRAHVSEISLEDNKVSPEKKEKKKLLLLPPNISKHLVLFS